MKAEKIEANPHVAEDCGTVAVMRGPVVYCLEGKDNGDLLRSINIRYDSEFSDEKSDEYGVPVLKTTGYKKRPTGALYSFADDSVDEVPLTFIPYFAHANRGASEMIVWVRIK